MTEVDILQLPIEYGLCLIVLAAATAVAVRLRQETWAAPFIAVLGTVAAWYMVEPLYFSDFFYDFTYTIAATAYLCVVMFLLSFCVLTPLVVKAFQPQARSQSPASLELHPEQIIPIIVGLWLVLLVCGIVRAEGNFVAALFPIEGRSGMNMWGRSAGEDAGPTGFLVSTGGYLYVLMLSLFGLLLPLTHKGSMRAVLIICIVISWPYAFLQGSRNVTLAVVVPGLASYLLIAGRSPIMKFVIAITSFVLLDFAMRAIIGFRNEGFGAASVAEVEQSRHLGLNMASELSWIVGFVQDGVLPISYGWGYLSELLNVIPRAIWPEKPFLGIDYAIARGFAGDSDIGVFATLSTGMIGQSILNFGIWAGPIAAAFLMACWVAILARLRSQGGVARIALFLVGIGLTFNLGRDITLLVLFPFVFGYIGVRLLESRQKRRQRKQQLWSAAGSLKRVVPRHSSAQLD